jgi:hypothetical protein
MITGLTRYRLNWRGKVVLQVSEWRRNAHWRIPPSGWGWVVVWRDAKFRDVMDISEGRVTPDRPQTERRMPPPPGPRGGAKTEETS